jgi:poly(hydroxyalkanoate) depolymerase family esterase
MYDGFPKGLMRLSRRLVDPQAVRRALRQVSDLMSAPPGTVRAAQRKATKPPFHAPPPAASPAKTAGTIAEIVGFGSNPGALRMFMYVPAGLPDMGAPLVVVLHGCGQHAGQFATETGWLALADRLGFAVVMPEQVAANNTGRCFNWFRTDDVLRDHGEAMSIREMVEAAVSRAHLDTKRMFVVGLSAGGAMAAALLVAYPDLFAAGASVAGLPAGCASDLTSALSRMARAGSETREQLAERARALGPAYPPTAWPRISIWQGTGDRTVTPANADQLAAQFAELHGIAGAGEELPPQPGQTGKGWHRGRGMEIELHSIAGMEHGYPIPAGSPTDRFILPVGVDATQAIAMFWGLQPAR